MTADTPVDRAHERRIDLIEQSIIKLTGEMNARFATLEGTVDRRMLSVEGKIDLLTQSIQHGRTDHEHALGGIKERFDNLANLVQANSHRITELENAQRNEAGFRRGVSTTVKVAWTVSGVLVGGVLFKIVELAFNAPR